MAMPPGPNLPAVVQTVHWIRRPVPFLEENTERYGDYWSLKLIMNGRAVITCDPEAIRKVFTESGEVLRAGEAGAQILKPLVGNHSVLVLDGAAHLRQRRLMLPSFHGERMKAYAEAMREITADVVSRWPRDQAFAVHKSMQAITLRVIVRTVFGVDDAARMKQLGDQLARTLETGSRPSLLGALLPTRRIGPRARFEQEKARADAMVYEEIARRRELGDAAGRTDVLSLLLEARDEDGDRLTDEEIRDELITLLAAGHETTATSLAWTFERMLSHRAVWDRARAEVAAVAGSGPVRDEHIGKLVWLDAIIKESLRLRPIIPMVARRLTVPMAFGGFTLPAGVVIAPSIYLTHRRADVYPEPERFKPERWLGVKPDPYTWLPFGGGIRRCLGMTFALYEMKIVLATVLQRADMTLAEQASDRIARRSITFAPADGARVVVRRL
jgi:cytochrome P450